MKEIKRGKLRSSTFDVLIVGGGPAGLSAALILGRCCRKVLVCDNGKPRNLVSSALHGYLGVDEIPPRQFLRLARAQTRRYHVTFLAEEVLKIDCRSHLFKVRLASGKKISARKILLATGLKDDLPSIPNIENFYGKSVFHCPYCDGWEARGKPLGVYGKGKRGLLLSQTLLGWSRDVTLYTNGASRLSSEDKSKLKSLSIRLCSTPIRSLEGTSGRLRYVQLKNGEKLTCHTLFFNTGSFQKSSLIHQVRGSLNARKGIATHRYQLVNRPGIYAAGNVLRDIQLSIMAAAEGAAAAFEISAALIKEDKKLNSSEP